MQPDRGGKPPDAATGETEVSRAPSSAEWITFLAHERGIERGSVVTAVLDSGVPVRIVDVTRSGYVSVAAEDCGWKRSFSPATAARRLTSITVVGGPPFSCAHHRKRAEQSARAIETALGIPAETLLPGVTTALREEDALRVESFPSAFVDTALEAGIPDAAVASAGAKIDAMLREGTTLFITVPVEHLPTIAREGISKRHQFGIKGTIGAPLFSLAEVADGRRAVITVDGVLARELEPIFIARQERRAGRYVDVEPPTFRGIVEFRSPHIPSSRLRLVREESRRAA